MTWGSGAVAFARVVNALFFIAVSSYCFLAYTPFAYDLFIKPSVVPALRDFVAVSPWLFWVVLLITTLTLMPQLRGAPGRGLAWCYVGGGLLCGAWVLAMPPLATLGKSPKAFALGAIALVPPISLALIDLVIWPAPKVRSADPARALAASVVAAVIACGVYAAAVPWRLAQETGIQLPAPIAAASIGSALVADLFVFMAVFLAVMTVMGVSRLIGGGTSSEFWLLVLLLAVCSTLVLYLLVCASLAFRGGDALACSAALGVAVAAVWADVARLRALRTVDQLDTIALFNAPAVGGGSRAAAACVICVLPFIAYALVAASRQFDWNFLLQKLSVLIVWLLAFASAYAVVRARPGAAASPVRLAAIPIAALALYHVLGWTNAWAAVDQYAVVDASFRLIRDARIAQSSETAEFYAYLRSNTLLAPHQVQPPDVDFVNPLGPAVGRKPHIFLIVVDSMRRDYLSAYNKQVTFTPEIGKLAADSLVFERAFTRYSGTGLAVPSIWAGGMVPHMVEQPEFARRNTLQKLLDANAYLRVMSSDSVVEPFVRRDRLMWELDRDKSVMDFDLCGTLDELERKLPQRTGPVFFYSLPQNLHIGVAMKRKIPTGETYPAGLVDWAASSLYRIDACVGRFVDFLEREKLYDDSVIILTTDHGDSLGEGGRWGHAYFMYPEVMNIPLIVHLPSWLQARVRTDLDAVVFSTDIVPSLYALLGYQPSDLGPLFGRSFFTPRAEDSSWRRRGAFLVASSYGAVYGVVHQNGRRLYAVDAVDGFEYAFDLSATPERIAVTPAMTAVNRRLIRQQLDRLASVFQITPQP